jgi:predicted phosphohydrolase
MSINKIAWLTDIHLNFLKYDARVEFYQSINKTGANAILITGDIAEATDLCEILSEFSAQTNMPIYFVLGNHDYYAGSVANVREKILKLCAKNTDLIWLGKPEIVTLNNYTALVGHDGWADARYGDFDHSPVNLNDSRLITELFQALLLNKSALRNEMQQLADADAETLARTLNEVINSTCKKVIIATHVPPFPECCWHKDQISDKNWLPYFASKATGDVIADIAQKHPGYKFLVLCGHTHTRSATKIFSNLEVRAGAAEYYRPIIQGIIEV